MEYKRFSKAKLGDLVEYILDYRGKTPKKSEYGIPTLSAKSVKNNYIDYNEAYFISEDEYNRFMTKGLPSVGDILLTMEAPLGLVATLDRDDVGLGQRIVTIKCKDSVLDNNYLKFYLQSPIGQYELQSRATGTTVLGISQKNLKNIDLILPPYNIQVLVGQILENYNKKIEINNNIIKNLEAQAQAIFKSWFLDFKPFQNGDFVESELGLIPEGWEVRDIKEISDRKNGYTYKSSDLSDDSSVNMITIKNFNRYGGQNHDAKKPIKNTERVKKHHILEDKDILVACTDLTQAADIIGRVILYSYNNYFDYEIYSMDVVKLVPHDITYTYFMYHYLNSNIFKGYAEGVATGTTVLHFPKRSIDSFKLIYPSKNHIEKFNDIIKPFIELENSLINEISILSQTRDTLLPKLMNGEIDVSNIKIDEDIDYD